jgi:hypothetical protein
MMFAVRRMHHEGRRREWRDIENDEPAVGVLVTDFKTGREGIPVRVVTLLDEDTPPEEDVLPDLYEPALVVAGPIAIRLRGYEVVDGRAFVQEWFCELEETGC